MSASTDNETWIIDVGDEIIRKKASGGYADLTPKEKLLYCLWVADYGMRNSGDLDATRDIHPTFQQEGASLAKSLSLEFTHETFMLSKEIFQGQYFERFDRVCNELRSA